MLERGFYDGDRVINSNGPEFDTAECGICLLHAWFVLLAGTMPWVWVSLPDVLVGSTASGKSNVNNALFLAGNLCA